ncbi:MAG TPA: hypothetical protein VLA19_31995 [Herpetosiphonaceae bacterium]|nr:hypothetical protein [Herpetosiphonaceae bacterium]
MHEHERGDTTAGQAEAATDAERPEVAEEPPVDPSINAGRDSFGEVSDFGVQPNAPDTSAQQP